MGYTLVKTIKTLIYTHQGTETTGTLSENRFNFDYLLMEVGWENDGFNILEIKVTPDIHFTLRVPGGAGTDLADVITMYRWTSPTTFTSVYSKNTRINPTNTTSYSCFTNTSYTLRSIHRIWGVKKVEV